MFRRLTPQAHFGLIEAALKFKKFFAKFRLHQITWIQSCVP